MLLLVSCANEDKQGSSGYGAINVQVSADYKVVPATRSTAESASTIENPDVSEFALKLVSSDDSFSRAWDSLADFDPATKIPVGAYTMSAFLRRYRYRRIRKAVLSRRNPGSRA